MKGLRREEFYAVVLVFQKIVLLSLRTSAGKSFKHQKCFHAWHEQRSASRVRHSGANFVFLPARLWLELAVQRVLISSAPFPVPQATDDLLHESIDV